MLVWLKHKSLVHLVQVFVGQQVGFSGLEAVLAFAFVENVGLKFPTRIVFG